MTSLSPIGNLQRTIDSPAIKRRHRKPLTLFLSGQLQHFDHQRHPYVSKTLRRNPYDQALMQLGTQTMVYRHFDLDKYKPEIAYRNWDQFDGAFPDPARLLDLPVSSDGPTGNTLNEEAAGRPKR